MQKPSSSNRKKSLCIRINTNEAGPSVKQCQLCTGLGGCLVGSLTERSIPECFRNGKTAVIFRAWPATSGALRQKMLYTRKPPLLFSPNTFVWVSQNSCVAALAWPEAAWESRRLCCPLYLLPSSHLFDGGEKLVSKTHTGFAWWC